MQVPGAGEAIGRKASGALQGYGAEQISGVFALLEKLNSSEECIKLAREILADERNANSESLWAILFARWSELDPAGMVDFARSGDGHGVTGRLREMAWFAWAATDSETATEEAHTQSASIRHATIRGIASVSPRKAALSALTMPNAQRALEHAIRASGEHRPEDLTALLERTVYSFSRRPMQEALVTQLARTEPAAALEAAQRIGRDWNDPVVEAFTKIASHDAASAIELLDELPQSRTKAIATVEIAQSLATQDADAALDWVRALPEGNARDTSLAAIASVIGGEDPIAGLALIEGVEWRQSAKFYNIASGTGGTVRNHLEGDNSVTVLGVGKALLRQLATSDPDGARLYIDRRVPAHFREDFQAELASEP